MAKSAKDLNELAESLTTSAERSGTTEHIQKQLERLTPQERREILLQMDQRNERNRQTNPNLPDLEIVMTEGKYRVEHRGRIWNTTVAEGDLSKPAARTIPGSIADAERAQQSRR